MKKVGSKNAASQGELFNNHFNSYVFPVLNFRNQMLFNLTASGRRVLFAFIIINKHPLFYQHVFLFFSSNELNVYTSSCSTQIKPAPQSMKRQLNELWFIQKINPCGVYTWDICPEKI